MSYTEALHYDRVWWEREDARRQVMGQGSFARIRLVKVETGMDDDVV